MLIKYKAYLPFAIFFILITCIAVKTTNHKEPNLDYPQDLSFDYNKLQPFFGNTLPQAPKGKYLVQIFSSWCTTCRHNYRNSLDIVKKHRVRILGVVMDDDKQNILNLLKDNQENPYFLIVGIDKYTGTELGIKAIPTTFLVDENGKILVKVTGNLSEELFRHAILPKY